MTSSTTAVLELRVLDGIHAGASIDAWDGMLLGTDPTADIVLADLDNTQGPAKLFLDAAGRWLFCLADEVPDAAAWAQAPQLGQPVVWAGVALCISLAEADWQNPPNTHTAPPAVNAVVITPAPTTDDETPALTPPPAPEAATTVVTPSHPTATSIDAGSNWTRRLQQSPMALASLALLVLAVGLTLAWLSHGAAPAALNNLAAANLKKGTAPLVQTPAQANSQRQALALVIAQVSPTLRLQLTAQADGRVRVAGWVESVAQLDQLVETLAQQRPLPSLQLHVASELRDELRARIGPEYSHIEFVPDGPGQLRVSGAIQTTEKREQVLASLRSVLPADLQLVDGLTTFAQLAPQVQTVLVAAGFADARTHWEQDHIMATLSMPATDRPELEKTLLALVKRFPGLPLQVKVDTLVPMQAGTQVAPFAIRSVVGGPMPYLVLANGSKLLPGGQHAGWRLEAIKADALVFDGPRRLSVAR